MSVSTEKLTGIPPESASGPYLAASEAPPLDLTLIDHDSPARLGAETFVRTIFAQAYGATLDTFYPVLMRITRADGSCAAIAGIRRASEQALFSEHYLEQPAEITLSAERRGIVEIGNLAPASAGQARWLIGALTAFLTGAGFTHVVFTAVPRLRNAFSRMGLPLTRLAEARPECLPDNLVNNWGSYYDNQPAVFSGDLGLGFQAFSRLMTNHPELSGLLQKAYTAGVLFTRLSPSTPA